MDRTDIWSTGEADRVVAHSYAIEAPGLQRYVRSLVRDQEEAADVCQEAFVRLLVHARCNGIPEAPGAWLRVVAHNLVVSGARRRATADRSLDRLADRDAIPSTEESIVRREDSRRVAHALAAASADDQVAMVLAAQGYPASEIGARLGRTELATRALICRARGRLRTRLTALEAVQEPLAAG